MTCRTAFAVFVAIMAIARPSSADEKKFDLSGKWKFENPNASTTMDVKVDGEKATGTVVEIFANGKTDPLIKEIANGKVKDGVLTFNPKQRDRVKTDVVWTCILVGKSLKITIDINGGRSAGGRTVEYEAKRVGDSK